MPKQDLHDAFAGRWASSQSSRAPARSAAGGADLNAEALVYYPVYSVWRTGQFVKMEFQGHFSPDSPASAGQSMNRIPGGGGKLKFKGTAGGQVVEYAAILDESRTRIVGGYLSTYPDDFGCFHLTNP